MVEVFLQGGMIGFSLGILFCTVIVIINER